MGQGSGDLCARLKLPGKRIAKIRRIHFVFKGEVDRDDGPLEITFIDGSVALFRVGPDGETLDVSCLAWTDPFEEPLSSENARFINAHGKWIAFDVGELDSFKHILGEAVISIAPLVIDNGSGLALYLKRAIIEVKVVADDIYVSLRTRQFDQGD